MKKVFQNANAVIHVFAQQSQSEGRSGNVYFERGYNCPFDFGNMIYSYGSHYLLGEFITKNAIMINDKGYSSNTSKHISQLSYATRQFKQFYTTKTSIELVHASTLSNLKFLANARRPEIYIQNILSLWQSMNEFAEFDRATHKVAKGKYMLYSDGRYKEVKAIVNKLQKDAEGYKEALNKRRIAQAKKEAVQNAKRLKISLSKFNAYEINQFRIGNEDFLRLSQDRQQVETSQGISVSIEAAKVLYKAIQNKRDIKGHRIDGYTVIAINGTLTIGCHHINMNSVHEIGKQLI